MVLEKEHLHSRLTECPQIQSRVYSNNLIGYRPRKPPPRPFNFILNKFVY
ncbi:hypothetical protein SAMN05444673_6762 [Bacillus sp. OV166]|nr:hypothetical protein SAMN05444673_6762 [Bacillus sp. OV166]